MRGRRVVVAVALLCALVAAVPTALAADAGDPGAVVDRSVTAVRWGASAECRRVAPDDEQCDPIDDRPVSSARVDAYQRSWVHRALALQSTLDDDAPLTEALLPHTHNTFNSSAYGPTLTNQDPNQPYSITDQLNMDVRAIELEVHWVPSPYGTLETGGYWPTLCHGNTQGPVHVGCSIDRPLQDGLAEVAAWMTAHPSEFVLLYLENQLGDSAQAHQVAGSLVESALGRFALRTPAPAPCQAMDWTQSTRAIEATGARLVIVGNCSTSIAAGTGWGALVHERGSHWDESGDPTTYSSAQCARDLDARAKAGGNVFRRYFEDQTWVGAMAGSNAVTSSLGGTSTISPETTALMVRCGVNIVGFDQLTPEDPRLAALVWSWAPERPAPGAHGCAYQGRDTRWRLDGGCGTKRVAACVSAAGVWSVTTKPVRWEQAARACASSFPGSTFAAPPNGLRNAQLASAARSAEVWVDVRL
jgi:hypothetical protein